MLITLVTPIQEHGIRNAQGARLAVALAGQVVEHDEEQVEAGQERVRKVDVARQGLIRVVRPVERVGRRHNATVINTSCVQVELRYCGWAMRRSGEPSTPAMLIE